MDVIVLRHALAEERLAGATLQEDLQRPLSERGRRRMRRGARALARMVPKLHAIATSPALRTAQTAEIVAEHYGGLSPSPLAALEPGGSVQGVLEWLAARRPDATLLLVGHNPDLEDLASCLLAGVSRGFLKLSKGGACLLRIEREPAPGSAQLLWSLTGKMLRQLG